MAVVTRGHEAAAVKCQIMYQTNRESLSHKTENKQIRLTIITEDA